MWVFNCLFVVLGQILVTVGLEVRVSKMPQTIIRGETALLQCAFNVTGDEPLDHITIQWLHMGSNALVHSYYYGSDQLKLQSAQYSGRTSLFPDQFKHGNISLKLQGVRPSDAGQYKCHVSTLMESDEGTLSVQFAAYYTEPNLMIRHNPPSIILSFESEGYPKADVLWYSGEEKLEPVLSETVYQQTTDNLYLLKSIMARNNTSLSEKYTFVLRNDAVKQTILRPVHLLGIAYPLQNQEASSLYVVIMAVSLIALVALLVIIALNIMLSRRRNLQDSQRLKERMDVINGILLSQ
ncbi:CD276 antigen-like [Callorhinchus milii]|uniref:CD276 antigen-like n=1 Tax=Callorhinchus milii TaxID=7868 RepID=UPI000457482D|nr:CD276 antigen-like [Callorhinchus milii]|eukprot:gi/632972017/ref/XP_007902453.1/ PREDICTED: CD276 antigen-like [Callorhinchus milii]